MLKIQAICHLGNDATVQLVNGKNVINFNAAHTEKFKNSEGVEMTKTTWLSCAYWVDRVAVANYLKKGTQIFLEGKPESKTYTNKDGEIVPQLHVRIYSLELLIAAKQQSPVTGSQSQGAGNVSTNPVDDLPF